MRKPLLILAALLVWPVVSPTVSPAEEPLDVRYRAAPGRMVLTMEQDIHVGEHESIAGRSFALDLELNADGATHAVEVTVDRAKASFAAHGMEQRLGTRQVKGRTIPLEIGPERRQLERPISSPDPAITLDSIVEGGLSISRLLIDTWPVLPERAVAVGTTWSTEQPIETLEGWAWASGRLKSRHRVTGIDRRAGHNLVSIESEATADLTAVEGGREYTGTLTRTLHWTFDAADGRLLTLSMSQESTGLTSLPQGEQPIRQSTRLDLAPLT